MAWDTATRTHATLLADRWCALILATYPPDAARLMAARSDPFANPLGATIRRATHAILAALPDTGVEGVEVVEALHDIVRVRAVQDFSPAEAVGFVFLLKQAAREPVDGASGLSPSDLADFDRRVDDLALLAFDLYTADRERIARIRVDESRRAVRRLLERAGLSLDDTGPGEPDGPPDPPSTVVGESPAQASSPFDAVGDRWSPLQGGEQKAGSFEAISRHCGNRQRTSIPDMGSQPEATK